VKHLRHLTYLALALFPAVLLGCSSSSTISGSPSPAAAVAGNEKVTVYYFHRTLRCISCLSIEKMARETLQENYPQDLAKGTIRWQPVDYWQDAELAKRFGVDSPTLVVTVNDHGKIASYRRLDDTWGLKGDSKAFHAMLVSAVTQAMSKQ
jgi:hypothetical protein